MSQHITVIDYTLGTSVDGFAVRIGPEVSALLRLANCVNTAKNALIKAASNNTYVANQNVLTFSKFADAVSYATSLTKTATFASYKVRVDCTIIG